MTPVTPVTPDNSDSAAVVVFASPDDLLAAVGAELGPTGWLLVDQARVDGFADATDDHQWIHVDPKRAEAESPYGGTIAHGYLTLALTNLFLPQMLEVRGISMGVNYGADKLRFPAAVPVGSQARGRGTLTAATEVPGGVQTTIVVTVEVEGQDKPGCVVHSLSRWFH